jgi:hypothetical protein
LISGYKYMLVRDQILHKALGFMEFDHVTNRCLYPDTLKWHLISSINLLVESCKHSLFIKISIKINYHEHFQKIRFSSFISREDNSSQTPWVQKGQLLIMCHSCKFGLLYFCRYWTMFILMTKIVHLSLIIHWIP